MNKKLQPFLIVLPILAIVAQPVQALSVLIHEDGSMSLHQGNVLGENSDSEHEAESEKKFEEKQEKKEEKREAKSENASAEQQREQAKKAAESVRESQKKATEKRIEQRKILKTVPAREAKQLKIKNSKQKTEVLIERKTNSLTPKQNNDEKLIDQERIETRTLQIMLPTSQKFEPETEQEPKSIDSDRVNGGVEQDNDQIKKIKQQRRDREDTLEIKSQVNDDGTTEIEIESGIVKAKLKSAQFEVDPATNNLTITSPSGESHTLLHLPDQALQQMEEAGALVVSDPAAQSELTVETKDDGSVIYKTKLRAQRRVFGLIPYDFESEVELNDADSQISVQPTDTTFIGRLLYNLSR